MPGRTTSEEAQFKQVLARNVQLPLGVGLLSAAVFVGLILYLLSALTWVEHTERVIGNANELSSLMADQETGMRGFLIAGDERFLAPYVSGKPKMVVAMNNLVEMVQDNRPQMDRLRRIQAVQQEWDAYAQRMIDLRRQNGNYIELVRAETGKRLFDDVRTELTAFTNVEKRLLQERSDDARSSTIWIVSLYVLFVLGLSSGLALFGRREVVRLSSTFGTALREQTQSTQVLQEQAWLRAGQTQLAEHLIGQLTLPAIGRNVLDFMARYLGVTVSAIYVRNDAGLLLRVSAHGFSKASEAAEQAFEIGDGLVGQTARDGKISHVKGLDDHYMKVSSGLGSGAPAELVLAPVNNEGSINGVVELGFLREVAERDLALLGMVAGIIGTAFAAAQYRQRLQNSLEETRQLNEELQVQQEELRTANEELEEQSRALVEAQTNLEHQHAELEQTNAALGEQAQILDRKNEALNQAQADLQSRADELQRASRYKSEFLANMSHELRTPLNSSLILAKLLRDNKTGNLNDEQLKFADTIYSAGNDLLNLINDILDISKVEAGKLELSPQFVSIKKVVDALGMMFQPVAGQKKLQFEAVIDPSAPGAIVTDSQRLEQILKNLLSNAVKFTEKGRIGFTVKGLPDGRVAFEVTDSGIGIAPEQQEAIFEAFRQADGTINRRYGGTGLGLSISRELAGLLGGGISVTSRPGQGSSFTLALPQKWTAPEPEALPAAPVPLLAAPSPVPVAAPVLAPQPAPAARVVAGFADDRGTRADGQRTVLVVEDDPEFAGILFDLAHEMGYRCLVAQSAEEAMHLAIEHVPSAILLDVRLPDSSGLGVLQKLKEHAQTRHIPVHVVAGEDFSDVALPMGAIGVAVKPTSREELRDIFGKLEEKGAGKVKRVLLVEDDPRQRESVVHLIGDDDINISAVEKGQDALDLLRTTVFDCMIIDLKLPDMDGTELLERMTTEEICSFPPVIVYTGRNLTREEEAQLNRYSRSIILKGARSPERLLDEVTLFLHKVESRLSSERQTMLKTARNRDKVFEGRKVLLVDDDVRNVFALTSALEKMGLKVEVGRDGFEALAKLDAVPDIDLVLMDVMMPGMDGLEATRRIRAQPKFQKLPIIAVTAKAMKDDQEQCRRAGTNDYLAKPIELDRLFSLLRVWMPSL